MVSNDPLSSSEDDTVNLRIRSAATLPPESAELAELLADDPVPDVRIAAARRCADLHSLAKAWKREADPGVRVALAATLSDVLASTHDSESLALLLGAAHLTDAIRSEVARRTRHPKCRRIAIESIQDEAALVALARSAEDAETRKVAADHVGARRLRRHAVDHAHDALHDHDPAAERIALYVPRILQQHMVDAPDSRYWSDEGTAVFVDISGFTMLSEQLARKGREGAEDITDLIGGSFEPILEVAYENGGSLLKFGGDALLLWFHDEGHAVRACRATVLMRNTLHEVGRIEAPGVSVTLRMSQGVHSGRFDFFAVGTSHVELLTAGPAWTRLVGNEHAAQADEIVISEETARELPPECVGADKAPGRLLASMPAGYVGRVPLVRRPHMPLETLAHCLSPTVRAHVAEGLVASDHRPVTIAFVRFEAIDAMLGTSDGSAAAEALHRLVSVVEEATERRDLALLASDIDADGGKLILTAGAPRVTGDDEERMLLALREIVSADLPMPVRIGVHRGAVFAGDIGPVYRRTYTVMGDAVNVAARLMAKAERGHIYASSEVLAQSDTLFETTELEPLVLKGKSEPMRAWSVGPAIGSRTRDTSLQRLPLIGRSAELATVRKALGAARTGPGRIVEIVGDAGIGKSRLLEALRDAAMGFRKLHAVCEAYTASTPYVAWRELMREMLEIRRDDADEVVLEKVRGAVTEKAPDLLPWFPLLAAAFDVEVAATPDVELLAEKNRRSKLHETVARFLEVMLPGPTLIEIENVHHMNKASAELFEHLAAQLEGRRWLFAVARRRGGNGFVAPESPAVVRLELAPLATKDALRMAQLASEQTPLAAHVLDVVAQRSGGNPQFLRDLLRSAVESGGVGGLPDSAEAAAMARIDALPPGDRAFVRRAAVFGLTFHPRMLEWFAEEEGGASLADVPQRLGDLFEDDGEGYLRFRHSLLRDAAYEGLPYKLRRRFHGIVATRLEEESDDPDDLAGILSLHYLTATEYPPAFRYAQVAAKRAKGMYAYVEAAALYARALEAARAMPELGSKQVALVQESLADAWYGANEFRKASDAYASAQQLVSDDAMFDAGLLLKRARLEEKLGQYPEALKLTERAREQVRERTDAEAARLSAQCGAWYATVLQAQGRTAEAMEWAERTVHEAEAADDQEALGAGYFVLGWAYGASGKEGGEALLQKSLEAYRRSGNRIMQAAILSNLGVVCQWEGRWDDALAYYERGRDESMRLGNIVNAAAARMNVAEIMTDRGELADAERALQETLSALKASEYRYFLAACHWLLGRVSLRAARFDEALARLQQARSDFMHVGAEQELLDVDARIAECKVYIDEVDAALALAEDGLARAEAENGEKKVIPLLQRVRGFALLKQGDPFTAREAFDASVEVARQRKDLFEVTLALLALIELDKLEGIEPPDDMLAESRELLAKLKVRAVPPMPFPKA